MTDRELLELAAKVAGVEINAVIGETFWRPDGITWNPLTDDSDALRLAVMLKLFPAMLVMGKFVGFDDMDITEEFAPDPHAAARRAIVRAAAAIAQQEQPQ